MRWSSSRTTSDRIGGGLNRMTLSPANPVDDLHLMQQLTLAGHATQGGSEQQQTIEHSHPYGFTTVPNAAQAGASACAEAMTIFMNGNRSHAVAIVVADRRYRVIGASDGSAVLHRDDGQQIHLNDDGAWISAPKSKKITLQIMAADGMPAPPQLNPSSGAGGTSAGSGAQAAAGASGQQQNGQGVQATQQALGTIIVDQNSVTITHPGNLTASMGGTFLATADNNTTLVKADGSHSVIKHKKSGNTIWVDSSGCWSSQPIQQTSDPYND
jgi:phage gp45-like